MNPLNFVVCTLSAVFLLVSAPATRAHEGHDHGAPPPPVTTTIAPRADASSADLELVAVARGGRLTIHVDTFRDNEPVKGASIEVDGPAGTVAATEESEGVYVLDAPWAAAPGAHDLAFTVIAGDIIDVLTATLVIPQEEVAPVQPASVLDGIITTAFANDVRKRVSAADATFWLVGGISFLAGLAVAALFGRRKVATISGLFAAGLLLGMAPDSVMADASTPARTASVAERDVAQRFADGSVFVPKPTQRILGLRTLFTTVEPYAGSVELPARVIPDPAATGYVQASISGRLVPPDGGFPRLGTSVKAGDVLAFVQPTLGAADLAGRAQDARELDQAIALERRQLERLKEIRSVVSRSQIEDAEIELEGLLARRASLDASNAAPEPLVAPVSGVVAAVQAVAGQIAEPNTVIFHIIDPARFWVEALSYQAVSIDGTANGRLSDGGVLQLTYRGSGLADRNQAIPVQFSIDEGGNGLRVGQLLTVLAATSERREGIAVPRTSVLRGANGQSIVFQHTNAERFVPREVRVEPLDGDSVLIMSGVDAGQRIVTQGAELLNQIR